MSLHEYTSSANDKWKSELNGWTGTNYNIIIKTYLELRFGGIYGVMYELERRTDCELTRELFCWVFYFPCCEGTCTISRGYKHNGEGNKHQNNTLLNASTVRHDSTCIISFLTRLDEFINEASQFITHAYTWCPISDASIWKVLSKSWDIGYIHGLFHDQACKKLGSAIGFLEHASIIIKHMLLNLPCYAIGNTYASLNLVNIIN